MISFHLGDNLALMQQLEPVFSLCYTDPPFNTGVTRELHGNSFPDNYPNFMKFLGPRLDVMRDLLLPNGSLLLHLDYREAHYAKVYLDKLFGRNNFMNEIIWAYDYGARSKSRWPAKHDTILWYVKDVKNYTFNYEEVDRIPYMAPGLVGPEKAAKGKTPTDVWWHTIVPTNGKERVGYPTQKPLGVVNRIVKVHSNKNEHILDPFCGSGTTGVSAKIHQRHATLIDNNKEAIILAEERIRYANRGLKE